MVHLQWHVTVAQVNGHRLLGMNHIEVVTILKDLPVNVRMVCARRSGDTAPYRLIDTSQDRAAFAARVGAVFSILVHGRYIWYISVFRFDAKARAAQRDWFIEVYINIYCCLYTTIFCNSE